ncbi:MAG: DUF1801 domain-containing protein [Thermoanaerobaculia bacterium]|nr:DUF1801 domain-containing protein [Thermoanaerobaculia bacterium]
MTKTHQRPDATIPQPSADACSAHDWRAQTLETVRVLIMQAAPEAVEDRKWRKPSNPGGVLVWSLSGIICTGETYRTHIKLTFARGASLPDPSRLFNSGLDANTRRAIDIPEGAALDLAAFMDLVRAAVAHNRSSTPG